MIQINDNDLPIMVAEKIINGTKPYNPTDLMKAFAKAVTGNEHSSDTQDMFDLEEIKEIADYLMVYYQSTSKWRLSHRKERMNEFCGRTR